VLLHHLFKHTTACFQAKAVQAHSYSKECC